MNIKGKFFLKKMFLQDVEKRFQDTSLRIWKEWYENNRSTVLTKASYKPLTPELRTKSPSETPSRSATVEPPSLSSFDSTIPSIVDSSSPSPVRTESSSENSQMVS